MFMLSRISRVWLLVTPWTIDRQAPLSTGFSRQEHWSGLPCLPPGDLPDPGMEPPSLMSPALIGDSSHLAPPGNPLCELHINESGSALGEVGSRFSAPCLRAGGAHSCCLFSSGPESRGLFHCLFGPAETRWCSDAAAAVQPQCLWCRPDSGRGLSTQLVEFRSTLTVPASTPLDEPWEVFIDSWAVANGLTVQSPLGKLQAHKQDTPLGGHTRW